MTIFYMSARNVEGILQGLPGAGSMAHAAEFPAQEICGLTIFDTP
jgi:hypothetical protein